MTNAALQALELAQSAPSSSAVESGDPAARLGRGEPVTSLSNRQKVAVVLAQLGPKKATPVLQEMSDPDAIDFTTEIANLPSLDTDTVVEVLGEFVDRVREASLVSQGGIDLARQFLNERLGKARADEVLDQMESKLAVGPLAVLATADPRRVVGVLGEQQPQTVAVLLAHMRPEDAARIMGALPPEFRTKVARRIAQLDRVDPAAVRQTTTLIEAKLRTLNTLSSSSPAGGASAIAEILNHADRNTERQILGQLEAEDRTLAEKIRSNLFTFEDVVALDDRSVQQILRRVPPPTLALALKGSQVHDDVVARIRQNLTDRASQALDEELETLGTVRTAQVDDAQAEVVRSARELDDEGVIVIARDDEVVR
jgi:flagellar motor switch protein FliG